VLDWVAHDGRMSPDVVEVPVAVREGAAELVHWQCCEDPGVALCGTELDEEAGEGELPDCVVCEDLLEYPGCPVRGVCSAAESFGWSA
jgi:hypothetical protein